MNKSQDKTQAALAVARKEYPMLPPWTIPQSRLKMWSMLVHPKRSLNHLKECDDGCLALLITSELPRAVRWLAVPWAAYAMGAHQWAWAAMAVLTFTLLTWLGRFASAACFLMDYQRDQKIKEVVMGSAVKGTIEDLMTGLGFKAMPGPGGTMSFGKAMPPPSDEDEVDRLIRESNELYRKDKDIS